MATNKPNTPLLDQLEDGPWPSFVTGLKRLADDEGYWKGGTVGVRGYGAGVIPRFSEVADKFQESAEFHTLRIMPPAGMHYDTDTLRKFCDVWEKYGSGLIAMHGQSGDVMFQGVTTDNVQPALTNSTKWASIWAALALVSVPP